MPKRIRHIEQVGLGEPLLPPERTTAPPPIDTEKPVSVQIEDPTPTEDEAEPDGN